jgi:hypothetical protein
MVGFARQGWRRAPVHGAVVAVFALTVACASQLERGDVLYQLPPPPDYPVIGGHAVTAQQYQALVQEGVDWFRNETLGNEKAVTDVAGLMGGVVEVPCEKGPPDCYTEQKVFDLFVKALDALQGVETSDLVIRFPPGARLFGGVPVPENLHTGLDVEAGARWPLGIVEKEVPESEQRLGYLPTRGGSPKRFRLGLTCALCHYSLDVDGDGKADLKSAVLGYPTDPPRRPEDAWAIGNQDLHTGWLFALTANPLLGFTVISGPVGTNEPSDALALVRWVRDNYRSAPQAVLRQVVIGMLMQPRGSADDTPDALHDPDQMPSIFTQHNWPYNYDGVLENPSDRNNGVWTGALDFTGLIGLAADRGDSTSWVLYWEPPSIYSLLPAETFADMMTRYSPAARWDPARQRELVDDILGVSDGVPGMLDPDSVVVMQGPAMPDDVYNHPVNGPKNRCERRTAKYYGGDAPARVNTLALLGTRARTPLALRKKLGLDASCQADPDHGKADDDEYFTIAVSAMLDWQPLPSNQSPLLNKQWDLVERGYRVFKEQHCDSCHAGIFLTDNRMNRLAVSQADEEGISPATTAGWLLPGRDLGPAIGTDPMRARFTRPQQRFLAPAYDPTTGQATWSGSIWAGLVGDKRVGYKTVTLRNLWSTSPYLHDGSVGVGFPSGVTPPGNLRALLQAATNDARLRYGMGPILDAVEHGGEGWRRPDPALSLQALLIESERRKIVASNRTLTMHVPPGGVWDARGRPPSEVVSMTSLGVSGVGHEYWVNDRPGGDRITALVAFLLALDDKPCEVPGEPSHCGQGKKE